MNRKASILSRNGHNVESLYYYKKAYILEKNSEHLSEFARVLSLLEHNKEDVMSLHKETLNVTDKNDTTVKLYCAVSEMLSNNNLRF